MAARQLLQTEEDGLLVCITAWDITENARNIQQLETERQRYQLLCKYTQDLLYDYDLHRDILVLYGDMERVNGQKDYSLVVEDFLATLPSVVSWLRKTHKKFITSVWDIIPLPLNCGCVFL